MLGKHEEIKLPVYVRRENKYGELSKVLKICWFSKQMVKSTM